MSINNITGLSGPSQRSSELGVSRGGRGDAAKSEAPAAGDTVSISAGSERLRGLTEKLANTPEVDSARVEQLRQAIADGSYESDSEAIADKMISMEAQLFG